MEPENKVLKKRELIKQVDVKKDMLDNDNSIQNKQNNIQIRKKINFYKKAIIYTAITFILIPIILCVILLAKVCNMQDQLDAIVTLKDKGEIVASIDDYGNVKYVYASEIEGNVSDKGSQNESLEQNAEKEDAEKDSSNIDDKESESTKTEEDLDKESQEETTIAEDKYQIKPVPNGKKVYLTFDDGPSENTIKILEVLEKYGVLATFFVNGRTDNNSLLMYNEMAKRGHTLGLHSFTHIYDNIYASLDNFKADLEKIDGLLQSVCGYKSIFYRFPGGSSTSRAKGNMDLFLNYLNENGYIYQDWNVSNDDAVITYKDSNDMANSVLEAIKKHEVSMVLMHDAANKDMTVEALPIIIDKLIKEGYEILPITKETKLIQQKK